MTNFIERKFENIKTNETEIFSNITKIHIQMPQGGTGFEKQHQSTISVISGEPASGKTYQLKEENKINDKSYFKELINLKDDETIDENIDIVLLDSIDEALTDYNNPKKLQDKLVNFVKRCQAVNPKVRFVISCRFLEWSNYFEESLKDIDKELRIYKILPLSIEDINSLLNDKGIQEEDFWNFINVNYLDDLLKNILIVFHIIENFSDYQTKEISFVDIYNDIVKKYLSQKGEDRQEEVTDIPLDELVMIASSLATYMSLNRVSSIDTTNLSILANELYEINGKNLVGDDLKQILNRGLFDKRNGELVFFHNTIQEYLVAGFIAKKDLAIKTIKELFASELRFYEEFEEVIVYLTNLKPELFDGFVGFDPFIFKRHPDLTKEQQEKLLLSILNKYKVDFSQMWGRWESFEGSTLVKFEKLDNLITILEKHATLKEHGYYLMKLLENNYTSDLKEYIFKVFEENISNKNTLTRVIRGNFIDNYEFNLSLYEFLKKHDLLKKDTHAFFMSFEAELFSSLYGIKYKYRYGGERITVRTDIDFHAIVSLLDFVPATSFKYIAPYLLKADAEAWFQYVVGKYASDRYNYKFMGWVVHAVLKHCDSVDSLTQIARNLQEKKIHLHFVDKEEMKLEFKVIEDIFWEVYFETDILQDHYANEIVSLYDISLDDIKKVIDKYPIKNYIEMYVYFRLLGNDVDEFLMQDENFKTYMQNEWERQKEYKKKLDRERKDKYPDTVKQKEDEKQFNIECLHRFNSKEEKSTDYLDIFLYAFNKHHDSAIEIDKHLQEKLSEKYPEYILRIKQKFKADILYKDIKNDLLSSSIYYDTIIYNYLFDVLDDSELKQIVKTKKDYIKLFWHVYKKSLNSFSDKFIKLSENYFDCFLLLSLHDLQVSVKRSEGEKIGHFNLAIHAFKSLNKFDKDSLKPIIDYLTKDTSIILKLKEYYEKEYLLELLALDKSNYSYILDLMSKDTENLNLYLKFLLQIDTPKAISDFFQLYNIEKRYKSLFQRVKEYFFSKHKISSVYDNPKIHQNKIKLYHQLMRALKNTKDVLDAVPEKYLKEILSDYYEFFSEYERPKGAYSPDIYDDMYSLINKIWNHMESSKYIDILKELGKSNNSRLSENAKYALTKAYEEQQKDSSYYKKIFDKDEKLDEKRIINNYGNYVEGNNHGILNVQGSNSDTNIEEKWYKKWWFVSLVVSSISGVISYFGFENKWVALGVFVAFYLLMIFFNPKKRFFKVALGLIAVGGLNIFPIFTKIIEKLSDIDLGSNPWIGGLMIISSLPLFFLDYKENKK